MSSCPADGPQPCAAVSDFKCRRTIVIVPEDPRSTGEVACTWLRGLTSLFRSEEWVDEQMEGGLLAALTTDRFHLQLMCENSGQLVPCGEDGRGYLIAASTRLLRAMQFGFKARARLQHMSAHACVLLR